MFLIKSITRKVVTLTADAEIAEAKKIMEEKKIRHVLIVDADNKLEGIISDRDVRSASPSSLLSEEERDKREELLSKYKVKDIMTKRPATVNPMDTVQDTLLMINRTKVGAFPVVDENNTLKGIVSLSDLIRSFIAVLGIGEAGALICVTIEDKVGEMKKLVDAITEENILLGSVLCVRHQEEGKRVAFPYLLTQNTAKLKKKLKAMGLELIEPMDWYINTLPKTD